MSESNSLLRPRTIRSFVCRAGRLTPGQERALTQLWPRYGVASHDTMIDINTLFGRKAPTVLEIGFGNGQSLLAMAANAPETNFIGIEVHRPGIGALLTGIDEMHLTNVRIFQADAIQVLQQAIPDHSLQAVYLFFPDPWHKKRHHKRRIVQPEFVQLVQRKLIANGTLHMATDWQEYAEHMLATMENNANFSNQAGAGNYSAKPDYRSTTKFEQRGERLGHGVWDLIFSSKK